MNAPPPLRLPIMPRRVLILSGHRMDEPERSTPRFPPASEPRVRACIDEVLDRMDCGAGDLALTQGAAGADLLMAERVLARGAKVQLLLPLPEREFVARSVLPSANGEDWHRRYLAVRAASPAGAPSLAAPGNSSGTDPFERGNEWLCATASACGAGEIHLICFWDGGRAQGPGGTAHMVDTVNHMGGHVHWIDSRPLQQ